MASITLAIPDALTARVVEGFCGLHNYNAETDGTKVEFMRKTLLQMVKRDVLEWEGNQAQKTAQTTGNTDIRLP
jgi:hypothetical protein